MAEMDTPTPIIEEKLYKKMAPKFFAFTPESNGYYQIAILVSDEKATKIMEKEKKTSDYIKKKIRGTVTIYKQPKAKNRPELIAKYDIQEFSSGFSGGYIASREFPLMIHYIFKVEGINEEHFDREYYSIYVELESTEDLDDIGILVHKGHKPSPM